jgi:hypothetical protein
MPIRDPEKRKAYMAQYYERYRVEHRGEISERQREWYESNRGTVIERGVQRHRAQRKQQAVALLAQVATVLTSPES